MDSSSYLDQWTQEHWDTFSKTLANTFGVDYTPTVYEPIEHNPIKSGFDRTGIEFSSETISLLRERARPTTKQYIATDPNGKTYHFHGLPQFCKDHGLILANMRQRGKSKGWTCRRA
jgi:hypothetical protein